MSKIFYVLVLVLPILVFGAVPNSDARTSTPNNLVGDYITGQATGPLFDAVNQIQEISENRVCQDDVNSPACQMAKQAGAASSGSMTTLVIVGILTPIAAIALYLYRK